jgi:hypothetical protein
MQKLSLLLLSITAWILVPTEVFAQDATKEAADEIIVIEKKPNIVQVPSTFGSTRLRNWFVLDSSTLVIEIDGDKKYKATLANRCHGLRFTDTLGFATSGPFELDKWTTIYLPDGERCHIRELTPYVADQ